MTCSLVAELAPFAIIIIVSLATTNLMTNHGFLATAVDAALEPNRLIGGSFSLTSRVKYQDTRPYTTKPVFYGFIHESYSMEQKRAKIAFEGSSRLFAKHDLSDEMVTFYLDTERGLAFLVNGTGYHDCKQFTSADLNKIFIDEETLLEDVPIASEGQLLVGPARFMLYADQHRDEFEKFSINVKSANFYLDPYMMTANNRTEIRVHCLRLTRDDTHTDSVPFTLSLRTENTFRVRVDFSRVKPLSSSAYCSRDSDVGFGQGELDGGEGCEQDRFMFPTCNACSRMLLDSWGEELFFERAANTAKFSFKAQIKRSRDDSAATELFVAYDGQLNSMRRDVSSDRSFGERRQVINFRLNRVYHTVERRRLSTSFSALAGVLDHGRHFASRPPPAAQCQVARLLSSSGDPGEQAAFSNPYSVGQLLAGADRFVYMGRAQVRGINARVYEAQGDQVKMPIWLDPPMEFMEATSSGGDVKKSRLRTPERGATETEPQDELAVLVYVGEANFEWPLLKLEIIKIRREQGSGQNGGGVEERQTIAIEDFMWDLVDSPTGERTSQLFSLSDLCSANSGGATTANQYARIDMLLQQQTTSSTSADGQQPHHHTGSIPALSQLASVRDLALLSGLQDTYRLPATMVYDFESRLVSRRARSSAAPLSSANTSQKTTGTVNQEPIAAAAAAAQVLASFRIADHSDRLVEPIYLGQVRGYSPKAVKNAHIRQLALSFSDCFFLAAHRGSNVYFGYEPLERLCLVDLEGAPSPPPLKGIGVGAASSSQQQPLQPDDEPMGLKLEAGQTMEMYRTNHTTDPSQSRAATWLKDQESASQQLHQLGTEFKVYDTKLRSYLKLRVAGVHVDDRDCKASLAINDSGSGDGNSKEATRIVPDKISGFGLSASDLVNNRLIDPTSLLLNDHSTGWLVPPPQQATSSEPTNNEQEVEQPPSLAMTYEQCHAACLSDFECQSFSLCVKDSRFNCIVSRSSFKSPDIIEQLQPNYRGRGNNTMSGGRRLGRAKVVKVELGAGKQVELVQSRSCVLYNKMSVQLFQRPKLAQLAYNNRRARPVSGPEDCADLCVRQNIQVFRGDIEQMAKWRSTLWPTNNETTETVGPNQHHWQSQLDEHRKTTKELCLAFFYLDETVLMNLESDQLISLQERIVGHEDQAKMDYAKGLCFVNDRLSPQEEAELREAGKLVTGDANNLERQPRYISMDSYSFKVAELFYEKHRGVWLAQSLMSPAVTSAYQLACGRRREGSHQQPTDEIQAGMLALREFLEQGGNFRELAPLDEFRCARACFLQTFGPWPACRSFDLIIDYRPDTGQIRSVSCYLNSITLRQAKATNRSDLIHEADPDRWQKRQGLKQIWHYEPRGEFIFDGGKTTPPNMPTQLVHPNSIKLHALGLWVVLLLGVASGLLLGALLGRGVLERRQGVARGATDAEEIIKRNTMEFINQINLGPLPQPGHRE